VTSAILEEKGNGGGGNVLWTWASSQRKAARVNRICGVRLVKAYVTSESCEQR